MNGLKEDASFGNCHNRRNETRIVLGWRPARNKAVAPVSEKFR